MPRKSKGAAFSLNYRVHIGEEGETKAREAILRTAERDCAAAEKAFGLNCVISNMQFSDDVNNYSMRDGDIEVVAPPVLSANVNLQLRSPKSAKR